MVEPWRRIFSESLTRPSQIKERFSVDVEALDAVVAKYPMRIPKYYFDLIEEVDDPIWKQCVPDPLELDDPYGLQDPLNEEGDSPTCGIVHRYPDRVLMCVSNRCAMYCRFCTRKRKVGMPNGDLSRNIFLNQIDYIKRNSAIRDVLLSGGDPLLLSDESIKFLLKNLRRINHVELLRIGTRVPCTLPQRITPKLCNILKRYHPLYINVHFNHPREITEDSKRACGLLADSGVPLGNQSVLLRGVNDKPQIMKSLVHKLLGMRVKPYYLFQMDLVKGTRHFRTRVETGIDIIESLVGHTTGFAMPRYVIDAPGGGGKIPVQPDYILKLQEHKVVLRNYQGKKYIYPQESVDNEFFQSMKLQVEIPRER